MDHAKQVAPVRRAIAALIAERDDLQSAPLTKAEAKLHVAELAKAAAARGRDYDTLLTGLADADPKEREDAWAAIFSPRTKMSVDKYDPTVPVPLDGLLCWLMGDELVRLLQTKIDKAKNPSGPSLDERTARLAKIAGELDALEREEEQIIRTAESHGVYLPRRPDVRPEIVLRYDPTGSLKEPGLPRGRIPRVKPGSAGDGKEAMARHLAGTTAEPAMARQGMPAPRMDAVQTDLAAAVRRGIGR